jgi:hypothetical protein
MLFFETWVEKNLRILMKRTRDVNAWSIEPSGDDDEKKRNTYLFGVMLLPSFFMCDSAGSLAYVLFFILFLLKPFQELLPIPLAGSSAALVTVLGECLLLDGVGKDNSLSPLKILIRVI